MLPTLSRLSVRYPPEVPLRHGCSPRYLRISPLHLEFRLPLGPSSSTVSGAIAGLSPALSLPTYRTAYAPFTPSDSGQRLPLTYYRGCWHVISRGFFLQYRQRSTVSCRTLSSQTKEVYDPKTFFPHAALLRQACAHCGKFPTAASRRSLDRVSVPVWPYPLSSRLTVIALVGRYPTN